MIPIMTVDDSKMMRMMIQKVLKEKCEVVGEAPTGEEAVSLFQSLRGEGKKPEIVFMDFNMEGMNGLEASSEILKQEPDQKIILVTALNSQDLMKEALDAGIKEFVVKPITEEKIMGAFDNVIDG